MRHHRERAHPTSTRCAPVERSTDRARKPRSATHTRAPARTVHPRVQHRVGRMESTSRGTGGWCVANCSLNQLSLEQPTVRPARGVRHVYMVWAPPGSRSDITKHQPSQHRRLGWNCHGVATLLYRFVRAIATLPRTPCTYVCFPPSSSFPPSQRTLPPPPIIICLLQRRHLGTSAPCTSACSLSPLADGARPPFMLDGHVVGCYWCCCFRGWPFKIWEPSFGCFLAGSFCLSLRSIIGTSIFRATHLTVYLYDPLNTFPPTLRTALLESLPTQWIIHDLSVGVSALR
jgi:hypothetical protein